MKKKILLIGSNGMLGSTFYKFLNNFSDYKIISISKKRKKLYKNKTKHYYFDVKNTQLLYKIIKMHRPNFVINCVGKVKKLVKNTNLKETYFINSIFPQILSKLSLEFKYKLIHFSTDCVFDGYKGNYRENDQCNAIDDYGFSKILGETNPKHTIILRTSIIGHEEGSKSRGLLNWFLRQKKQVLGYKKAIFSGLPTIEIAEIVNKYIIEKKVITNGLFNIASKPISKYDLLKKIAKIYKKKIEIKMNYSVKINRSLNGKKFKKITNYSSPSWDILIKKMLKFENSK